MSGAGRHPPWLTYVSGGAFALVYDVAMQDENSRAYLEQRYRDSLERAERASDPAIARVYREFAAKYAEALSEDAPIHIRTTAD